MADPWLFCRILPCDFAAADGIFYNAFQGFSYKRRVVGFGLEMSDCPGGSRIKDNQIRVSSFSDPALVLFQAVENGGIQAHFFHQLNHGQTAGVNQIGNTQGKGSLQSDNAAGSLCQRTSLFFCAVGRMICGNNIDNAFLCLLYTSDAADD